jgi:hypothetical protein
VRIADFLSCLSLVFILVLNPFHPFLFASEISAADLELLKKIEKDHIQYFIRFSDKISGLTRDSSRSGSPASIAATGFALSAVAIGQSRGWINREYARAQIEKTLKTLVSRAAHKNGFFYHFLDARTGRRVWNSEASSIDTALVIAGALLAAQYYPGTNIERMAHKIYARVDWPWMMNNSSLICMGWTPEGGFLPYYWDTYSEHIILQALAIGSPTHAIPAQAWQEWFRNEDEYNHKKIIYSHSGSLFTYQFSHAYIDFKNLNDRGINYFENSKLATLANREYSLSFKEKHKSYSEFSWGLSASLGPGGYKAYGGKPGQGLHDGTIAPYAAVSSIVFTPKESLAAIKYFFHTHGENLYGPFGFKDAFNLDKGWWAQEYLGIDQGISVMMLENFIENGVIWKKFMALKAIQSWIQKCGLDGEEKVIPAA